MKRLKKLKSLQQLSLTVNHYEHISQVSFSVFRPLCDNFLGEIMANTLLLYNFLFLGAAFRCSFAIFYYLFLTWLVVIRVYLTFQINYSLQF